MDNDRNTFNTNIEAVTPRQSDSVRTRQFDAIMTAVSEEPAVSPYAFYATKYRTPFVYMALFLVVVLGTSSTVAASETARPGDLLFPVDRAKEEIRLRLADDTKKAELTVAQLDERYAELLSILSESAGSSTVTEDDEVRIAAAVTLVTKVAISLDTDEADNRLREVLRQLDNLVFTNTDRSRISVSDDSVEIRTDTERVRLEKRRDDNARNDDDDDDNWDNDKDDNDEEDWNDREDSRSSKNSDDDDSRGGSDGNQDDDDDTRIDDSRDRDDDSDNDKDNDKNDDDDKDDRDHRRDADEETRNDGDDDRNDDKDDDDNDRDDDSDNDKDNDKDDDDDKDDDSRDRNR